jgi:cell division inhibitor SepF
MNRLVSTEASVVQRNTRAWLGLGEHDSDALANEDEYATEDVSEIQNDDEAPSGQLAVANGIQIAIVRPRNFRDATTVGEYYRKEIPVIINLDDMNNAEATRIIDFVSGLILGLCGDIERLSRRAFLIVPAGATILTTHDGLTEEGFFNQALRRWPPREYHEDSVSGGFSVTSSVRISWHSSRHSLHIATPAAAARPDTWWRRLPQKLHLTVGTSSPADVTVNSGVAALSPVSITRSAVPMH